jgi:excisionase family DNA binding protein
MANTSSKLHRVPEAALEFNVAPKTVWNWVGQGRIATVRIGRSVRIPHAEILRLIEEGTTPARRLGGR